MTVASDEHPWRKSFEEFAVLRSSAVYSKEAWKAACVAVGFGVAFAVVPYVPFLGPLERWFLYWACWLSWAIFMLLHISLHLCSWLDAPASTLSREDLKADYDECQLGLLKLRRRGFTDAESDLRMRVRERRRARCC